MSLALPTPVSLYFEISNGADAGGLVRCFASDAVVVDEGRTHQGLAAIQSWQREAKQAFDYTVQPSDVKQDGDRLTVTTNVEGNFPGSPVALDHVFELAADKITSLEIG
ncbi:SnoaL-like domain [Bordetella ansorpii]|uniref:SnoaL-like domain n=1 Tax=Bordetella ansorpii TaxID=288768 RepID=A0A157S4J7_9BORD|nr:nuclear transport factor 2 family protein [Bordetella ansorpii]SAI65322.1 SnoaL-like domain [Bordetella ansorpii]